MPNWNTTSTSMSITPGMEGGFALFIVIIVVGAIVLLLLMTSLERYVRFFQSLGWIIKSIKYAIFGTGISAAGAGLYAICKIITAAGSGIDPMFFVWMVGGYIALTLIGYTGERVVIRMKNMHARYKESQQKINDAPIAEV